MNSKEFCGPNEFNLLYTFLSENFRNLKSDYLGVLTEAVCSLCSALPAEQIPIAITQTSSVTLQLFGGMDISNIANVDRFDFARAIIMLTGQIKAFDGVSPDILAQSLLPLIVYIWPLLCSALENLAMDSDLVTVVCNLMSKMLHALKHHMSACFLQLSRSLFVCFNQAPNKNFNCLRVFCQGCTVLKDDPQVQQIIA